MVKFQKGSYWNVDILCYTKYDMQGNVLPNEYHYVTIIRL